MDVSNKIKANAANDNSRVNKPGHKSQQPNNENISLGHT